MSKVVDLAKEWRAANILVALLLYQYDLKKFIPHPFVSLHRNLKITFFFFPREGEPLPKKSRYGYRPGLEIDWKKGEGDVDAWNPKGGDLLALFGHGIQIVREHAGFKAESPTKLLKAFLSRLDDEVTAT